MPCTLNETSLLFALQCSLLKQYVYLPSTMAVKEWSPEDTVCSWIWYALLGLLICNCASCQSVNIFQSIFGTVCTQKSMSKFPLPPNSRSPTWKVTVILSSAWSCSWKHSFVCALSWMLWAAAKPTRASSDDSSLMVFVCSVCVDCRVQLNMYTINLTCRGPCLLTASRVKRSAPFRLNFKSFTETPDIHPSTHPPP